MTDSIMYHNGNRQLQDRFDSRRISDRLEEKLTRVQFTSDDRTFIESVPYFFLATADADGRPDCSYKGGMPGFVRVTGPSELAFPDYDGNGMFKSLGNILVNPTVGILFIAMHGKPQRLRVNGEATVSDQDPLLAQTVGAQLIVRVAARAIFPNCPRYIPTMQLIEPSKYAPQPRCETPEPAWKGFADFKNYVHPGNRPSKADEVGDYPAMGFNPRKMEAGRKAKADAEVAAGRATDAQVLQDAERPIGDWNERQARRMPLLFAPTPRWRSATVSCGCVAPLNGLATH